MNETLRIEIAEKFRNTTLGFSRIKRNLDILHFSDAETESYLKKILLSKPLEDIEAKGKNYYFKYFESNAILTVNSHSFTIITAKQIVKR